jgi:hypothetical protein
MADDPDSAILNLLQDTEHLPRVMSIRVRNNDGTSPWIG